MVIFVDLGQNLAAVLGFSGISKYQLPQYFPSSNLIFDHQKSRDQTLLRHGPTMSTDAILIAKSIFKVRSVPRIAVSNFGVQYFFWPIGRPNGRVLSQR
jgi:hypothetical protein